MAVNKVAIKYKDPRWDRSLRIALEDFKKAINNIVDEIEDSSAQDYRVKVGVLGTPDYLNADFFKRSIADHIVVKHALGLVTKTDDYTITDDDAVILCNGTFTLTLPTAVGIDGRIYTIKNIGTGEVTIDGNGDETIDDGKTATLTDQYEVINIVSDNTEWFIF